MSLSVDIDNKKFTLLSKIIDNDRIFLNINCEYDGGKNDFFIYKSNSQGMWRYLSFTQDKIFKGDDYTTTTMIDFELQNFINENIDNIPYGKYTVEKLKDNLKDINMAELKIFFTGREEFVPEFEMIWYLSNIRSNNISKNVLSSYLLNAYRNLKSNTNSNNNNEYILSQLTNYYISQIYNNNEYKSKDNIKKYDFLKIISNRLEDSFILEGRPIHMHTFDKEIFMFENAKIVKGDIIHNAGNNNNKVQTKKNTKLRSKIYPFSENIDIYSINISYTDSYKNKLKAYSEFVRNVKYKVYYMKYKIVDDKKTYYMPLLVTPEKTIIDIYGMPDKYVKTGIFCNKPWDYTSQCFYKKTQQTAKKINRCSDTYAFIGNNYRAIWPWNQPIITGEESIILESANNNNLPSSNISNINKDTNIVIKDAFICNTNQIGKGAFGYVYKCYDEKEEQNFAIKFTTTKKIKTKSIGKEEDSLLNEKRILNNLFYDNEGNELEDAYENNHIVKYYKLTVKETDFLTSFFNGRQKAKNIPKYPITLNSILKFEYCNRNLMYFIDDINQKDNFITTIKIPSFSETNKDTIKIDFKNQIFDGLNYLFERRIVHFDIKKENILVSYTQNNEDKITPTYKISDFGSSSFNKFKNENLNLIHGTYDYLPIFNNGNMYKFYPLCFTTYGRDLYHFFRCVDSFYDIYTKANDINYSNPEFPKDKKYFEKFGKEFVSVKFDFINTSKITNILSKYKPVNDLTEKEYIALYKQIKQDFDKELRDLMQKRESNMFTKFVNTKTGEAFGFFNSKSNRKSSNRKSSNI